MKQQPVITALFLLLVSNLVNASEQPFVTTRVLSMPLANQLAMSAAQTCRDKGYQVSVSVVDRNGNPLAMVRDPLSGTHTIDVSLKKAQTAATFQTDTITMQKRGDEFSGLKFARGVLIIGGGVPVRIGGHFYGAVGVSGAPAQKITGDVDDECARAGISAVREAIEFAE
ncbi:MAG: heme-binding protein [Thioalkalispiraceae bacterium]|jgi:uncharacterized protein GlcG (DUF336 family)